MDEMSQTPQPITETGSGKIPYMGYVITALITAIVVSGAWGLFGISTIEETPSTIIEQTNLATNTDEVAQTAVTEPTAATTTTDAVETPESTEIAAITSKLLLERFQRALYEARQVNFADQHEKNTDKMYYVTDGRNSLGIAIWEYDANNDPSYAFTKGKNFNVVEGSRVLLEYKVKEEGNIIFRVGLSGNNFVFFEMNADYSPGPCAQPEFWLNANKPNSPKLQYIDVTAKNPVAKPYTPTKEDKEKAAKELKICIDTLR